MRWSRNEGYLGPKCWKMINTQSYGKDGKQRLCVCIFIHWQTKHKQSRTHIFIILMCTCVWLYSRCSIVRVWILYTSTWIHYRCLNENVQKTLVLVDKVDRKGIIETAPHMKKLECVVCVCFVLTGIKLFSWCAELCFFLDSVGDIGPFRWLPMCAEACSFCYTLWQTLKI